MKKCFYTIICLFLFLACKNTTDLTNIRRDGVLDIQDEFSSTTYRIEKEVWQINRNNTFELDFNETNNIVDIIWVKVEDNEDKYSMHSGRCLRKIEGNRITLDFSQFISFVNNVTLDSYLKYKYDICKSEIKRLEKKQNKTESDKKYLEASKRNLINFTSVDKWKEVDPNLESYNLEVKGFKELAKIHSKIHHIGMISDDKMTISFPKFFFGAWEIYKDNNGNLKADFTKPIIHENVVFKKR